MKRIALLILTMLMAISVHAEKAVMDEKEFTVTFLERLKKDLPDSEFVSIADLHIDAKNVSGYDITVFLGNAYSTYTAGNREFERIYQERLASLNSKKGALSSNDVKSILPVLKPRDYIETAEKQLRASGYDKKELPFYFEKFNDDLYKIYVFDSPDSMRLVTPEDLTKHGITDSISHIANKNIEHHYDRLGAQISEIDTQGNGRVFLFTADDNYEASILAAFGYLNHTMFKNEEDWVVFIPARNIALIVGVEDAKAFQIASEFAIEGYRELGYAISPFGYISKNGSWLRFEPTFGVN